jgi:hypothetical protein
MRRAGNDVHVVKYQLDFSVIKLPGAIQGRVRVWHEVASDDPKKSATRHGASRDPLRRRPGESWGLSRNTPFHAMRL